MVTNKANANNQACKYLTCINSIFWNLEIHHKSAFHALFRSSCLSSCYNASLLAAGMVGLPEIIWLSEGGVFRLFMCFALKKCYGFYLMPIN